MSEPIKIVVTAETQQGADALRKFTEAQKLGFKEVAAAAHGASSALGSNRMAMMELGHVGRSMADGLAAGISPLRMLALESPRILQAMASLGVGFAAILPYALGVGAAVGAGYLGWKAYMSGVEDTTKEMDDLVAALDKVPALLDKINERRKAGLISNAAAKELNDKLKNPPKLYRDENNQLTTSPTHQEDIKPDIDFGPAPDRGWKQRTVENTPLTDAQNLAEAMKASQAVINQTSEEQTKAVNKLSDLVEKARVENLSGLAKEEAQIHDKYEKEREEIRLTAGQAGKLIGPGRYDAATTGAIGDLDKAEAAAKLTAEQKAQAALDEAHNKALAESNKLLKDGQQLVKIVEEEWAKIIADAHKRVELAQEIRQEKIRAKLENIQSNPYLNDQQKADQSIPLYEQQISGSSGYKAGLNKQLNSSTDEAAQLELKQKIAKATADQIKAEQALRVAQGQGSWESAYTKNLIALQNTWQNVSASLTNGAFNLIQAGVNGIARALTSVVMGTQSAAQAFGQFATSLISSFIEMVVEAILWAKVAIPILTYLGVVSGGTTAAAGAAVTIAAVGSAMAMAATFADGGLVSGPGTSTSDSIPARLSHGEYVINADAVSRFGVDRLHAINQGGDVGYRGSSAASSGLAKNTDAKPTVVIVNDRQELLNFLKSSDARNTVIAHINNNKPRMGFTT